MFCVLVRELFALEILPSGPDEYLVRTQPVSMETQTCCSLQRDSSSPCHSNRTHMKRRKNGQIKNHKQWQLPQMPWQPSLTGSLFSQAFKNINNHPGSAANFLWPGFKDRMWCQQQINGWIVTCHIQHGCHCHHRPTVIKCTWTQEVTCGTRGGALFSNSFIQDLFRAACSADLHTTGNKNISWGLSLTGRNSNQWPLSVTRMSPGTEVEHSWWHTD